MASTFGQSTLVVWVIIMLAKIQTRTCCMENERKALLELKDYVSSVGAANVFPSWTNDTESDCCNWGQIRCNLATRHVIGITLSIKAKVNSYFLLNLSLLHPLKELQSLSIHGIYGGWFDPFEGYKSLGRLGKLEILDLTSSDVNNTILPFLTAAASLKTLILRHCNLAGLFPIKEIKHMKNLEKLDLSGNLLNGSLPGRELSNIHKLKALDLSANEYFGSLEGWGICELTNLQEIDLSRNKFVGYIPPCLGGLSKLLVLDLSNNQLNGTLPSLTSNLISLEYLSLYGNSFEGLFPLTPLTNLSKLKVFKLSSRSKFLQLEIPQGLWQPKFQLKVLGLKYCNLGAIPSFLKHQKSLRKIDLSNNNLFGRFPAWILEDNPELEVLHLGSNAFSTFRMPRLIHNLKILGIAANNLVGRLPEVFGHVLPNVSNLNLSHNGFEGDLPSSLSEMKHIQHMDLSYNSFTGQIFQKSAKFTDLRVLKMNNNKFTGRIGCGLRNSSNLSVLDLSNNNLTGSIPSWIARFPMFLLSLSNNGLQGKIDTSLFNNSLLTVVDLSGNMLYGSLPSGFLTHQYHRVNLYLHDNNFTGIIPDTLAKDMRLLDLRYNKLSGTIPQFQHTQNISILLLRGNNLTGHIPTKFCSLTKIILLDLAYNGLNGSIPSCLPNVSFGLGTDTGQFEVGFGGTVGYDDYYKSMLELHLREHDTSFQALEIDFASKYRYDTYASYMYGLDLAGNKLSGEIPKELGALWRLRVLNLSHNYLSGNIPMSISNITDLESLDLSFNRLSGLIPREFYLLHSLAVFDVAYNNLSGVIPLVGKLITFNNSTYTGNPFLCGQPTNRSCSNINGSETEEVFALNGEDIAIDMVVFHWSFTVTYVTVFSGFLLFMCFETRLRQAWISHVDAFIRLVRMAFS